MPRAYARASQLLSKVMVQRPSRAPAITIFTTQANSWPPRAHACVRAQMCLKIRFLPKKAARPFFVKNLPKIHFRLRNEGVSNPFFVEKCAESRIDWDFSLTRCTIRPLVTPEREGTRHKQISLLNWSALITIAPVRSRRTTLRHEWLH
jgi:hypothetical protein